MNKLDYYYRGYKVHKQELNFQECKNERQEIKENNIDKNLFETTKFICSIDETWIIEIEKGLEFVEKAVGEERQFIRTNGEVTPIEKVKKVSRNSVEHLAKHSSLITKVPEKNKDIVPEKIYVVEKLTDYAVYENRFLYMMLCFLRDFMDLRLEKIEKIRRTYLGHITIEKHVQNAKKNISYNLDIMDQREDNPFIIYDKKSEELIYRIRNCSQIVISLLKGNLMQEVSKSPMIRPPVVKTNVLKMNNNFKKALALYDYVASYQGDGYEIKEIKTSLNPFSSEIDDDISSSITQDVFLEYMLGNDIKKDLEKEYQNEEERRKELEKEKLIAKINHLKKMALESNNTMEEYMVLLEKRNQMLQKDSEELANKKIEITLLNQKIDQLNLEKEELTRKNEELKVVIQQQIDEIARLNQKYIDDMEALRQLHAKEITDLEEKHQQAIVEINNQHAAEIEQINSTHQEELLKEQHEFEEAIKQKEQEFEEEKEACLKELQDQIQSLQEENAKSLLEIQNQMSELNKTLDNTLLEKQNQIKSLEDKYQEMDSSNQTQIKDLHNKLDEMNQKNTFIRGQLHGLQAKRGQLTPNEDYTSREKFLELEEEFEAFNRYFENQWKMTKKQIKQEVFHK